MRQLPKSPAVYFISNAEGELIYIGKARDLRRRLGQYRNAKRRKRHKKMRVIVKEAHQIRFTLYDTHREACIEEARLIQELRPRWNIAGAFYFMYPMVGLKKEGDQTYFCFTTTPEFYPDYSLHGSYRSRERVAEGFFALIRLLKYVGHASPRPALKDRKKTPHSYVYGFRKIPDHYIDLWNEYFQGESKAALETLILDMLENAGARAARTEVQEELRLIARLWKHEIRPLAQARKRTGFKSYPVSQKDRDILFLNNRFELHPELDAPLT